MEDWQQRVVDEKAELDEKRRKLAAFFETPAFAELSMQAQIDLQMQAAYMGMYSDTLGRRLLKSV